MNDTIPMVKCRKCEKMFPPNMKTSGHWLCPSCQAKNPNLKRHYRSVAILCILGLVATVFLVAVRFSKGGLNLGIFMLAGHGVLLLVTIVFVYKAKTPWTDGTVKALIWTVFGLALIFNVVLPFALSGRLDIPLIVIYAIVFGYLFWLNLQARKCTATEPPPPPKGEVS